MTAEELKQQYNSIKKINYSSDYEFFKNNYSVSALSKISGEELAIRLFAKAGYGDSIGVRGYFCWAEHGGKDKGPVGTAKIGTTSNIQYDGTKYYVKNNVTTIIQKERAIACAENIRTIFTDFTQIVKRYIDQNQLTNIKGYQNLKNELVDKIKNPDYIAEENRECIYNTRGFTAYVIKYFHCQWNEYFAFWYGKDSLLEIIKNVLGAATVEEDSLVLNGQLCLYAKGIGADNDNFGVLMGKLKDEKKANEKLTLSGEAQERQKFFTKYLNYFLEWFNNWGVNKKYYGELSETVKFKTVEGRLKDLETSRRTLNQYKNNLIKMWNKYRVGEYKSPYDIEDSSIFEPIMQRAQNDLDADTRCGYSWYLQFLNAIEMGLNIDDLNTNGYDNKQKRNQDMDKKNELNLILYGPPGTGKTFNTIAYALAILEKTQREKIEDEMKNDYDKVKARYDEYKRKGFIEFVTFHQSYSYEEFIEGIKPETKDGQVLYEIKDGIFKKFCNKAKKIKDGAVKYGLNDNPTVWKVSLDGSGRKNNPIHKKCLDDGCIRIGWDGYGEDLSQETQFKDGGRDILNNFINEMEIGDIVLSCYSESEIDAIGVITGEYEWCDNYERLKRTRTVNWLKQWKGAEKFNIKELNNGKKLTLSAVYRANVLVADILSILDNSRVDEKFAEYDFGQPYVFIIDEINRGNVSKIFGELITLIEPSKRLGAKEAMTCKLTYSGEDGEPFGVPQNVYIIGTMNTADRSLVQLDAALRRRFAFEEMMPEVDVIRKKVGNCGVIEEVDVPKLLETINKRITSLLDREHQIGHSYFMEVHSINDLAYVFNQKIIPLLQEYFFDDYDLIKKVLSGDFIEESDDIFDPNKKLYSIIKKIPTDAQAYINIYSDSEVKESESE